MNRLLIANRGEIAVRIITTAQDLGIACISVYPDDDGLAQHVRLADDHFCLPGAGAAAYLDIDAIIAAAVATNADAIHPGYGFLSERHDFAAACDAAGITFVGPTTEQLAQFGNKAGRWRRRTRCRSFWAPMATPPWRRPRTFERPF